MATRKKPSSTQPTPAKAEQAAPSQRSTPPAGAYFAMPLADGRWGACRVLAERATKGVVIENLDWLDPERPSLDDLRGVGALVLDHHAWVSAPNRFAVDEAPPSTFEPLGVVELSADERATKCSAWGSWEALALHTVLQWRWHHDRKALLAEEAREAAEREKKRLANAKRR